MKYTSQQIICLVKGQQWSTKCYLLLNKSVSSVNNFISNRDLKSWTVGWSDCENIGGSFE